MRTPDSDDRRAGDAVSTAVRLNNEVAIPLAVIRRRAKQSELRTVVPHLCGVVWEFLKSQNLRGGRNVAVYLNGNMDIEVGCEMSGAFEPRGDVVRSATPAGTVASATHLGPYQKLGATHDAIRQWCSANGYRPTG